MGHVAIYTGTDVLNRYWRRRGHATFAPMGWDAFGLPAENYAIKKGVPPQETTTKNITNFRRQMDSVGFDFDWWAEINTSSPDYYRWTQWLFTVLYEQGLAYQAEAAVNWCESCQTVLANEQVINGRCERCTNEVTQKMMRQWFFKITEYAEELLAGLDELDWPEKIKQAQRNWLGRSEGSRLEFKVADAPQTIEVFTTRADTLYGCTYLVLAPEHPLVAEITAAEQREEVERYVKQAAGKSELERTFLEKKKTGVFTGAYALNPINQERVPIWVADYVVMGYGTGAIMAVPAHDERDWEFAQQYQLPIKQVVAPYFLSEGADAPVPDKETVRRPVVMVLVKHWSDDAYYVLDWTQQGWHSVVIGGIDEGETPEEAAVREVKEETGYQNIKSARVFGPTTHANFYAHHKEVNRYSEYSHVVIELGGPEYVEPKPEEVKNHTGQWMPTAQVAAFLNLPNNLLFWDMYQNGERATTGEGVLINSGAHDNLTTEEARAKITAAAGGRRETMWRLRDWLVSRQRYWGAPIPIVHCPEHGAVALPPEQLPVRLPEDVDFKPTGHSPLADSQSFNTDVHCPRCGVPAEREVDTMDTFVCSSWYYLRFPSATNDKVAFDPSTTATWLPVDEYVGGAEHAVLHLLYARFFTKALRDAGYLSFDEPFLKLRTIGLILGPDHQKMSKSRGNVINPDEIVQQYGADALRLHELFMGPFAEEKPWNTESIKGVVRFLDSFHSLGEAAAGAVEGSNEADRQRQHIIHQTIKKVTEDLAAYRFNTAVSALMTALHHFEGITWTAAARDQLVLIAELLSPLAPHLASELYERLAGADNLHERPWPSYDAELAKVTEATWAAMVNGKVRGTFTASPEIPQEEAEAAAREAGTVPDHLEGKTVREAIFVPGRLVNFVTSD